MFKAILWDVDGTLLDFKASESNAIKALFKEYLLGECTDEMVRLYSSINDRYWEMLERNEMTKPEILVGRFAEFFRAIGVDDSIAAKFNSDYQDRLGDTIVFRDESYDVVKSLRGRILQYVVSNGTTAAQTKKLRLSGLGELVDGVFLSESVGIEKPNIGFFTEIFRTVGDIKPDEMLIVGDSLTRDIKGGNNA
jgi:2-haloacid dehalogenase